MDCTGEDWMTLKNRPLVSCSYVGKVLFRQNNTLPTSSLLHKHRRRRANAFNSIEYSVSHQSARLGAHSAALDFLYTVVVLAYVIRPNLAIHTALSLFLS